MTATSLIKAAFSGRARKSITYLGLPKFSVPRSVVPVGIPMKVEIASLFDYARAFRFIGVWAKPVAWAGV
jgi:hypothetical protein